MSLKAGGARLVEMTPPPTDKMRIGLGHALNAAAATASGHEAGEARRRERRKRLALGVCAFFVALTTVIGYGSLRAARPTTDEWAYDWDLAAELAAAREAAGDALRPFDVLAHATTREANVDFLVLRVTPPDYVKAEGDPFSPEEIAKVPALTVRPTAFGDYALLLNRFPALPGHALLVTKAFAAQAERLSRADLDALHRCAAAARGLGFYNSDAVAGASQPHRHFQVVPGGSFGAVGGSGIPLDAAVAALPREAWKWSGRAPFAPVVRTLPALAGLRHGLVRLPARATFRLDFSTDGDFADALVRAYALLLHDLGLAHHPPHNLLLAEGWMLLVPRGSRDGLGVDVNALGYAGCLLARDAARFEELRRPGGALGVLRAAGVS